MCRVSFNPAGPGGRRSPSRRPLLVQLPQVVSRRPSRSARPGSEPVRISCSFGVSPRPLTISPFSSEAVCVLTLLCSECRSLALFATTTPLAFCHGPCQCGCARHALSPPGNAVLRYARQLVGLAPAAWRARAMRIGTLEPAEISAVALAHAGHEDVMSACWAAPQPSYLFRLRPRKQNTSC